MKKRLVQQPCSKSRLAFQALNDEADAAELKKATMKATNTPSRPNRVHKDASLQAKEPANLKTAVGRTKLPMHHIPPIAFSALGLAMANGAHKYGPFNWQVAGVVDADEMFSAMLGHLLDWWNGENFAKDSGIHHLAHLMAGAAICLDSFSRGELNMVGSPTVNGNVLSTRQVNEYLSDPNRITEAVRK
jgi:hypothetical protein